MVLHGHQLQIRDLLHILKKPFLLLDLPVDPPFHLPDPALHLLRLHSDVRPTPHKILIFYGIYSDLAPLAPVRPLPAPRRRRLKLSDLLLMFFILRQRKSVLTSLILPPAGEIAALYLKRLPVQNQYVVHAGVQQIPIMGYQNIPLLPRQIGFDRLPGRLVQMIGRLVDQQKIMSSGKQHRQHHFCTLPMAERPEGPVKNLCIHTQTLQLATYPPELAVRLHMLQKLRPAALHLLRLDLIRKIIKPDACMYTSAVFIFSKQKLQKRRLSFPVPPQESQLPVRINRKRNMFKNIV